MATSVIEHSTSRPLGERATSESQLRLIVKVLMSVYYGGIVCISAVVEIKARVTAAVLVIAVKLFWL